MTRGIVWSVAGVLFTGLLICSLCFIYIEKLKDNYHDIVSGYDVENCTTYNYNLWQQGGSSYNYGESPFISSSKCRLYSLDRCLMGIGRTELTQGKTPCSDRLLDRLMNETVIGSSHLYYHFNARPDRYYSPDKYLKFVAKYSDRPMTDTTVLVSFTSFFAVGLLVTLAYLYFSSRKRTHEPLPSFVGLDEMNSVN